MKTYFPLQAVSGSGPLGKAALINLHLKRNQKKDFGLWYETVSELSQHDLAKVTPRVSAR